MLALRGVLRHRAVIIIMIRSFTFLESKFIFITILLIYSSFLCKSDVYKHVCLMVVIIIDLLQLVWLISVIFVCFVCFVSTTVNLCCSSPVSNSVPSLPRLSCSFFYRITYDFMRFDSRLKLFRF